MLYLSRLCLSGLQWSTSLWCSCPSSLVCPAALPCGFLHLWRRGGADREVPQNQLQVHNRWQGESVFDFSNWQRLQSLLMEESSGYSVIRPLLFLCPLGKQKIAKLQQAPSFAQSVGVELLSPVLISSPQWISMPDECNALSAEMIFSRSQNIPALTFTPALRVNSLNSCASVWSAWSGSQTSDSMIRFF